MSSRPPHKLPTSMEEFAAVYMAQYEVTGYGPQVEMRFPCPFCAFPDWAVASILDVQEVLRQVHHCPTCTRSARFKHSGSALSGSLFISLVQTAGPEVPSWYEPKPPREIPS